jgi:hypothetical protein
MIEWFPDLARLTPAVNTIRASAPPVPLAALHGARSPGPLSLWLNDRSLVTPAAATSNHLYDVHVVRVRLRVYGHVRLDIANELVRRSTRHGAIQSGVR